VVTPAGWLIKALKHPAKYPSFMQPSIRALPHPDRPPFWHLISPAEPKHADDLTAQWFQSRLSNVVNQIGRSTKALTLAIYMDRSAIDTAEPGAETNHLLPKH
jgi:hypothetical protein